MEKILINILLLFIITIIPVIDVYPDQLSEYQHAEIEIPLDQPADSQAEKNQPEEGLEDHDYTKTSYHFLIPDNLNRNLSANFRNQFKRGYPHILDEPPEYSAHI